MFRLGIGLGPFLYCDYWASVFNLAGIVSPAVVADGRLTLGHFRRAVDRPRTRLPQLRYYILAFVFLPVLLPYRVVYDLMRLFHGRAQRLGHPVDEVISRHRLVVEPAAPGRVRAVLDAQPIAEDLIDPRASRCEVSLFYPTYKLLLAGLLAIAISFGLLPYLTRLDFLAPLGEHVSSALYVLLAIILLGLLRDPVTALVAPLPIVAFRHLWQLPESIPGLILFSLGFVVLFFLVEWFIIPRGLPPTLFLYVNEPGNPAYPYAARGHAPYWLKGRRYWVWRFVTLVPGELHKFWERDWERVECWVRADGTDAGRLEWVVGDVHYREVWYDYTRLTTRPQAARHGRQLARREDRAPVEERGAADGDRLLNHGMTWVIEVDMDPIFHAPYVRELGLYDRGRPGLIRSIPRLLRALFGGVKRDRWRRVAPRLEELETDGTEIFADVPEHFRRLAAHLIVAMPWSYWRFALGAASRARRFLYSRPEVLGAGMAAEPAHQIKERAVATSIPRLDEASRATAELGERRRSAESVPALEPKQHARES